MLQSKKTLRLRREPSTPQGLPAICRGKPRLNSDEPKKLPPLHASGISDAGVSSSESPSAGKRIEGPESVLNAATAEDWSGPGAEDGEEKEADSGNADEEAKS